MLFDRLTPCSKVTQFKGLTDVCLFSGLHKTTAFKTYDVRKVELTPLEQRKLTFDSHALVKELESSGMYDVALADVLSVLPISFSFVRQAILIFIS